MSDKLILRVKTKNGKAAGGLRSTIGIVILLIAVVFILEKLDVIPKNIFSGVGVFGIILAVIFTLSIISDLVEGQISDTLIPLAFLCIIFKTPLGLEKVTPWPILITALLGTISLKMIIPGQERIMSYTNSGPENPHMNSDNDIVKYGVFIGDGVKYITSKKLERVELRCVIGDLDVFMDKAEAAGDRIVVDIHEKLGDLNLYIPKNWKVVNNLSSFIGDYNESGDESEEDGTVLELTGVKRIGDLNIHRV